MKINIVPPRIWVTSDLHLGHNKDFLYGARGFENIREHDEILVNNWNSLVEPYEDVYILGDVMLNDINSGIEYMKKLNGNLKFIFGNHDTDNKIKRLKEALPHAEFLGYATRIKYRGVTFFLSHYPTYTGNYDMDCPLKQKVVNLCGHSHTKDRWVNWGESAIYHVELDAHAMMPITLQFIIDDIKARGQNSLI